MLRKTLLENYSKSRLRLLLTLFFLALAIPTGALIWQAYSQLKWEAFHQYRGMAEGLTGRIDAALSARIDTAEARSFADYTFLVVSGDPSANFVQRSPLSELPVAQDLPGVIGYFQVGIEGEFSTPLLPESNSEPASFGIDAVEYKRRLQLSGQIQSILSDNRLVQSQPAGRKPVPSSPPATLGAALERADAETEESEEATFGSDKENHENRQRQSLAQQSTVYDQAIFDELSAPRKDLDDGDVVDKVAGLKREHTFQKKSERVEEQLQEEQAREGANYFDAPSRSKRREQSALAESKPVASVPAGTPSAINLASPVDLRISTFESEIDPLEFSLLDSGHFVLFRKVWREGERYIQGLLIDQEAFVQEAINSPFQETGLAAMSNLIVAYQDGVLHTFDGADYSLYPNSSRTFDGPLLYRSRLSAPLNSLELIYSINGLPPGPGAAVLGWVTFVLAVVFLGGFYTVYRLGLSQINLARQQQDFVSAVSHELKTPLTSIRMYGEMLRDGWADAEKQQQYYEYIHDESERLTRLISNVLQLAKITRNEPKFDLKPVPVDQLMKQAESKVAAQVRSAGFELDMQTDPQAGKVRIAVDEDCFAQILINLIDNAIKFSRDAEHKRIEISSRLSKGDTVTIAVRDFGPGVPKDRMKKIFRLFYRSESELTRETVGTGIGLAIVHELSQAMGGRIDVVNQAPGAEFRVSFDMVDAETTSF